MARFMTRFTADYDATRLAYVELLGDEQKPTVIGFLSWTIALFNSRLIERPRVMSDHGPAYVFMAFLAPGLRHTCIRLYPPKNNAKAERFIQTLCREWAYAIAHTNS
jgi:hypothetical protein